MKKSTVNDKKNAIVYNYSLHKMYRPRRSKYTILLSELSEWTAQLTHNYTADVRPRAMYLFARDYRDKCQNT